jgi:hypothetical protein
MRLSSITRNLQPAKPLGPRTPSLANAASVIFMWGGIIEKNGGDESGFRFFPQMETSPR